ncbi:hypothetical protein Clacol_001326 [Clathrus columnatus]|uniref:E3 ubiquitin-protein ligase RNF220 middle domain-containing protein n=1 Tax=Clathrus columnatus TaxID=1419009 RepID=A0AAV4ZY08_9AGAM|nr:hypothetical protein Clacol_001326 [Clathrus columnatus]
MPTITPKGKKHSLSDTLDRSTSEEVELDRKAKKSKKADTRVCPVCQDTIPVRLLATHEVFELQRVEEICQSRLEDDDLLPWEQVEEDLFSAGPSRRNAAVRARRSLNPGQGSNNTSGKMNLIAKVSKTIKTVQRHRRERHMKLKELLKVEIDEDEFIRTTGGSVCPVCQNTVPGDGDFVEAHIDACLRHAAETATANGDDLAADGLEEYEVGGETRIRIARSVNFRGAGYDVRNPRENDVEDDIDIDGDDAVLYGETQFTEADIIGPHHNQEEADVDIDNEPDDGTASKTPEVLSSEGKRPQSNLLNSTPVGHAPFFASD